MSQFHINTPLKSLIIGQNKISFNVNQILFHLVLQIPLTSHICLLDAFVNMLMLSGNNKSVFSAPFNTFYNI